MMNYRSIITPRRRRRILRLVLPKGGAINMIRLFQLVAPFNPTRSSPLSFLYPPLRNCRLSSFKLLLLRRLKFKKKSAVGHYF